MTPIVHFKKNTNTKTKHVLYFWKSEGSEILNMTLMHHQRIISASLVHHQCIISASSVHHQCIISASSVHHQTTPDQDSKNFNLADLILELGFLLCVASFVKLSTTLVPNNNGAFYSKCQKYFVSKHSNKIQKFLYEGVKFWTFLFFFRWIFFWLDCNKSCICVRVAGNISLVVSVYT